MSFCKLVNTVLISYVQYIYDSMENQEFSKCVVVVEVTFEAWTKHHNPITTVWSFIMNLWVFKIYSIGRFVFGVLNQPRVWCII